MLNPECRAKSPPLVRVYQDLGQIPLYISLGCVQLRLMTEPPPEAAEPSYRVFAFTYHAFPLDDPPDAVRVNGPLGTDENGTYV